MNVIFYVIDNIIKKKYIEKVYLLSIINNMLNINRNYNWKIELLQMLIMNLLKNIEKNKIIFFRFIVKIYLKDEFNLKWYY